jgi:hypothetical protein
MKHGSRFALDLVEMLFGGKVKSVVPWRGKNSVAKLAARYVVAMRT